MSETDWGKVVSSIKEKILEDASKKFASQYIENITMKVDTQKEGHTGSTRIRVSFLLADTVLFVVDTILSDIEMWSHK
jgi:hypothetical protein